MATKKTAASKTAAKKTTSSSRAADTETSTAVRHSTKVTKTGDTATASCSCGWSVEADPKTAGSAAAVHAGQSRRARAE